MSKISDFQCIEDADGKLLLPSATPDLAIGPKPTKNHSNCAELSWDAPLQKSDLPFPIDCLIPSVRSMVEEVTVAAQTPLALAGQMALGILATVVSRRAWVQWKGNMFEPTNLYTMIVCAPSERKSTVVSIMKRPLSDYIEHAKIEWAPKKKNWDVQGKVLKNRFEQLGKKKNGCDIESPQKLAQEMLEHELAEPKVPRYFIDDVTNEALGYNLSIYPSLGMISSEGNITANLASRYSGSDGGAALATINKAWSGDEIGFLRMGRECTARDAVLTIAVTTQPGALADFGSVQGAGPTGLLSKFLYVVPDSLVGGRLGETPAISEEATADWASVVNRLLDMRERELTLNPEAAELLTSFVDEMEARIGPDKDLAPLAEWIGKLQRGQTCRLAGVLHCCEDEGSDEISEGTMKRALALARYYICQAWKAFETMESTENKLGKRIVELAGRKFADKSFTVSDIVRGIRIIDGMKATVALVEPAMTELVAMNRLKKDAKNYQLVGGPDKKGEHWELPGNHCPAPEPKMSVKTEDKPTQKPVCKPEEDVLVPETSWAF